MAESISELIVQNDGLIFKVAKYIIATGGFLFFFGLGLSIFLGIFSRFTDEKNEEDKSFEGIQWKMMGYGFALVGIVFALILIVSILYAIYSIFTSAAVLSWLFYPFILFYNMLTDIPIIYYFLSAIIVLLVMIFIRLNANKKRED